MFAIELQNTVLKCCGKKASAQWGHSGDEYKSFLALSSSCESNEGTLEGLR